MDTSRNPNSNSNSTTSTVYPLVRLNDVKEDPPEIKSTTAGVTGTRKRKQSFAFLTPSDEHTTTTLKNKPDLFDIAFCTQKPEFVGSIIFFIDREGYYFNNILGICSICKRPYYTQDVDKNNLHHGAFICSPCFDVVDDVLKKILCQLKIFHCVNNNGECYKYKNTKNHHDSASYDSLKLCEGCTAMNILNSFDLDDMTTFKIWRSIHPKFNLDFKEISFRRNTMFPNRGKLIVLNEKGEIVSANIVRSADQVNNLRTLNRVENRHKKKLKVLIPNEKINYEKLKGARVKQVVYNSGLTSRLPIATFDSITGVYPLVLKKPNASSTSPKIKEEELTISDLNTLNNDTAGISKTDDDAVKMNNKKFFIKRQEGFTAETSEKIKTLLPSTFSFENDGRPIITIKDSSMPPSPSCFTCSSKGINQLLFCSICVEPYHPFCIEDKKILSDFTTLKEKLKSQSFEKDEVKFVVPMNPGMYNQEIIDLYNQFIGWKCKNCIFCDLCNMNFKKEFKGFENEIIKCTKCNETSLHIGCILTNSLVSKSFKLDPNWTSNWNCPNCLSCKSCGCNLNFQQQQNKNSINQLLCQLCTKRRKNGHFCPVCQRSYDESDYETPMVECTKCSKWIHSTCEEMTNDDYMILGILPEEIEFECRNCKKIDPPIWKNEIIKEYLNGVKIMMNTFKTKFLNKINGSTNENGISSDQDQTNNTTSARLFTIKIEEHQDNNIIIPKEVTINNELISKYNIVESKVVLVDFMHKSSGLRKKNLINIYDALNNLHDKTLNMAKNQQTKSVLCLYQFVVFNLYNSNKFTSYLNMDICIELLKSSIKEAFSWFKIENLPKYNGNGTFLEELTTNNIHQNEHIFQQQIQTKRKSGPMFDLKPDAESVFPNVNPFAEIYWNPDYFIDKRACRFCDQYGDHPEALAGRLLHFGYDNWVHINCALWSSEVWEETNGRLQQVGPALKRCDTLICGHCKGKGASVNCCQKNCNMKYHFMCCLEAKCQMLETKEVYCPKHIQLKTKTALQQDFEVMRNITIDFDSIRKYEVPISSSDLVVFIGSLCITNLGEIVPISVTQPRLKSQVLKGEDKSETILVPLDFKSMRIFRSTQNQKNLNGMTRYFLNTKFKRSQHSQLALEINKNINFVVDHSSKDFKSNREKLERIKKFAEWIENSPRHIDEYNNENFAFPFIEQLEWNKFIKEENKIFQLQNKINEHNLHQNQSNFNLNNMKINGHYNDIIKRETTTVIENLMKPNSSYEKENMSQLKQLSPIKSIMRYSKNGKINNHLLTKAEIIYEILCNNEIIHQSTNVENCWNGFLMRVAKNYPSFNRCSSFYKVGISRDSIQYLFEQLPKASELAWGHKFKFQTPQNVGKECTFKGSSRTEIFTGRKPYDMFGWLASKHRVPFPVDLLSVDDSRMKTQDLPMAMRYRLLKKNCVASKNYLVYCSKIQGRDLYTKVNISQGELIIEYSGEIIRSSVCDIREKYYESRGIGCYFFRIDENDVIDATLKGSGARFINHSCEPNCESKILKISGKKRIIIFALIDIAPGEELTYDYKFCKEAADKKIPCNCSSKKCRKFLN